MDSKRVQRRELEENRETREFRQEEKLEMIDAGELISHELMQVGKEMIGSWDL